jgi:demethylmenaquinone methyltransferase/2-methoxy-6-polyprenyl-1,4-benzoquinol methylase
MAGRYRRRAVAKLALSSGQTAIDVACGTGLNFADLIALVGPEGRVVGVDLSPDMLAIARKRVAARGWKNVELIESSIEEAELPSAADAALFSLTHDVLQSRKAVANVLGSLAPGGRVAAFGAKSGPRWAVPFDLAIRRLDRRFVTNFEGFARPWEVLGKLVELEVETVALGWAYLAAGRKPVNIAE